MSSIGGFVEGYVHLVRISSLWKAALLKYNIYRIMGTNRVVAIGIFAARVLLRILNHFHLESSHSAKNNMGFC
jgi:hypothetical protein